MTKLTITRGLPGSGKTTWARVTQALDPDHTVIVNRDAARRRLFGSDSQDYYECDAATLFKKESLVTEANAASITAALKAGFDVIVDDTNLPVRRCRNLRALATQAGADFEIEDFSGADLEVCLARNAERTDKQPVPDAVIKDMHQRYIRGGLSPVPPEEEQDFTEMVPEDGSPHLRKSAYIFDIDGTLAHIPEGGRSPYDYTRVQEDAPDDSVITVLNALSEDHFIILVSGRKSECRDETGRWLESEGVKYDRLLMREEEDDRADWKVKYDLFNEHIRPEFYVQGVFDDRVQVLRMWETINLKTFRVGGLEGGNF